MSKNTAGYGTKPAQFRFPQWAHEFLASESAAKGVTKTEVLVRALECYRDRERNQMLERGYADFGASLAAEVAEWDAFGIDAEFETDE